MDKIASIYNPRIPEARSLAEDVAEWIRQRGRAVEICTSIDARETLCLEELDLLVTLGGDGSILQAARLAAPYDVPILGINLGRVGFLTEACPDSWREVLSRALLGDYWVEERLMLQAVAEREGEELARAEALNEVVVGRGAEAHVVHLVAEVDGGRLASYVADGLIVATPTGSTAYAMAAGGPILPPELRNILLVPVSAHLSMSRPIVLSEGATVCIKVSGERPAILTVDGQVQAELEGGDRVWVETGPHVTRFARVKDTTYFYRTLVDRLNPRNHASSV